jgi:hypothetical protein
LITRQKGLNGTVLGVIVQTPAWSGARSAGSAPRPRAATRRPGFAPIDSQQRADFLLARPGPACGGAPTVETRNDPPAYLQHGSPAPWESASRLPRVGLCLVFACLPELHSRPTRIASRSFFPGMLETRVRMTASGSLTNCCASAVCARHPYPPSPSPAPASRPRAV